MAVRALLVCYSGAFLLSAALLFSAQPMIAKFVLPIYGGSSAVWTTCMVFFQTMLLAGYAYAYATTSRLSFRAQIILHIIVILAPIALLPFAVPADWAPPTESNPSWSLALLLLLVAGAPMFVVSTSAPLLQRWFAETTHASASDPYFLYAISNAGSMVALISYPFLIEPILGLTKQAWIWMAGYGAFTAIVICCAVLTWRMKRIEYDSTGIPSRPSTEARPVTNVERMWWIVLSLVPSSWMLAVTSRLTTDIAPMPMLWIIPLVLYLLTFVLVFASRQLLPHKFVALVFPCFAILLVASLILSGRWQLLLVHLSVFFVGAMFCHGELVQRRPAVKHLAQFYLCMSIGGVLGGVFNALVAPVIFPVLLEYPIAIAAACALHRGHDRSHSSNVNLALLVGTTLAIGVLMRGGFNFSSNMNSVLLVVASVPVLLLLFFVSKPKLFTLSIALVMIWSEIHAVTGGEVLHVARSFFGVHRVVLDQSEGRPTYHLLLHGTTQHGFQETDPARAREPLGYYHRRGPLGEVMALYSRSDTHVQKIGVIGLGTGATACYASDRRHITFYEVDPVVKRIAETSEYFTYLNDSGAENHHVQLGDGRQMIAAAPAGSYDMILLDAFSSDSVPTHLLTREALKIYESKLADNGLILFHVSNNHLDLTSVLGNLASDAGYAALLCEDLYQQPNDERDGKSPSTYVAIARRIEDVSRLVNRPTWRYLPASRDGTPWTDDYSNIVSVLKWDPRR